MTPRAAAVALLSLGLLGVNSPATAATIQLFGSGSAVSVVDATADFENPASLFDNPYIENGLSFSRTNLTFNNNDCGFAGCASNPGFYPGFTGNYMYGAGNDGFFTIETTGGQFFTGLEFVAGHGGISPNPNELFEWSAFRLGIQVGGGSFQPNGVFVIGFSDPSGFDELQFTRHILVVDSPAFDSVRAQYSSSVPVPEPASLLLLGVGLAARAALLSSGRARGRDRISRAR